MSEYVMRDKNGVPLKIGQKVTVTLDASEPCMFCHISLNQGHGDDHIPAFGTRR